MTRLPIEPGDHRYRPRVDESLAVKAKGETEPECRVLITEIRRETLGDITPADVKDEGFRTAHGFYVAFRRAQGLGLDVPTMALLERLECVVGTAGLPALAIHPGADPSEVGLLLGRVQRQGVVARKGRLWSITPRGVERLHDPVDGIDLRDEVWVVTFKVDQREIPRYLAPAASPAGTVTGYTEQPALALVDPGPGKEDLPVEAVDKAAQARITERAGMTAEQWRALEEAQRAKDLEEMSLGQRLDKLIADAKREGRPVSKDVRVIERRMQALQRGRTAA